jgi:hypothetical protein
MSSNKRGPLLWIVERQFIAECLVEVVHFMVEPSARVVVFTSPEAALEELKRAEETPDVLTSAFYFNGGCRNGLWLIQEARKMYGLLPAILISGYPAEHVARLASDREVKPDLILHKGEEFFKKLTEGLKELLGNHGAKCPLAATAACQSLPS